jgi:hypothetical protein
MARIGDTIQAGLNTYDPSPYLQAQQRATSAIGSSIASGIGAVGDAIKDRRDKKDSIKTSKELAKAMATLFPESASAMEPIIAQLDDEETPLSQRAALGAQIGEFINMGVQKSRDTALMDFERQKIGLEGRRVAIAEAMPQLEADALQNAAISQNDIQLNDALSRFSAIAEMEAPLGDKLPDMTGTQELISKYIEEGEGQKALNAVESYEKARIKQMEPLMAADPGLRLTEIPDVDATGQPINRSVFVSPQGDLLDLNRQPINQTAPVDGMVLPPRNDIPQEQQRRIQPMPNVGLGIRPATSAVTPTQAKIEEAKLAEIEQNLTKQADIKKSALAGAEETLKLIDELPTHPGFAEAVGAGFYRALGAIPGIPDDLTPAGADKAGAVSKIETLQAGAFLTAIQQLRGLGALSNTEGEKLQAAAANLNRKQSEEDFKKSLLTYRRQVQRVVEELKSTTGAASPAAPATSAADRLKAAKSRLGQ